MDYKGLILTAYCCDIKACDDCPSNGRTCCRERAMQELSAALKSETARAEAAEARAEKAEMDRDSSIQWIREFTESIHNPCVSCKHDLGDYVDINICGKCSEENSKWEWNGGKKEE